MSLTDTLLQSMEVMLILHEQVRSSRKVIAASQAFHAAIGHHDKAYLIAYHNLGVALDEHRTLMSSVKSRYEEMMGPIPDNVVPFKE